MLSEFDMFDLGLMHYFLGIEVVQSTSAVYLSTKTPKGNFEEVSNETMQSSENTSRTRYEACQRSRGKNVDGTLYKKLLGKFDVLNCNKARHCKYHQQIHGIAKKDVSHGCKTDFAISAQTIDYGILYVREENNQI